MLTREDLRSRFDLDGRVAIVTGGSRGIGRALATSLASCGARVVVSSRKAAACEETVAELRSAGGEAIAVPGNMGDLDDVAHLVAATVDAYGAIDLVVNNAANALAQRLGSITPEAWEKSQAVNERGPLFLAQAATPHLLMLTRSMAAELGPKGIRVNALAPGAVDTDMMAANPEAAIDAMRSASIMGRLADPDEMVGPGLFLLSDLSSFVTGSVLVADGGMAFH